MSDVAFIYRGYGGGLEVKLPGKEGNVTKLQAETLQAMRAAGGIGVVVTSVREVDAVLDSIDRAKGKK